MMKRALVLFIFLSLWGFAAAKPAANAQKTTYTFTITGISSELLTNANSRLTILQKNQSVLNPHIIRNMIKQSPAEIRKALEPYGYYKPVINKTVTHAAGQWQANFKVSKGLPVIITGCTVRVVGPGSQNVKINQALAKIPLKEETILTVTHYNQTKKQLMRAARSEGYLFAYFSENSVTINVHSRRALVVLTLNTGPRYYFGEVTLSKTALKPAFLKKFFGFKPGDPYNERKLADLQRHYVDTGYFGQVSALPKITTPDYKAKDGHTKKQVVPIDMKLKMAKRYLYQVGGGYGTYAGPQLTGALYNRYANSYGDKYNITTVLSRVYYDLHAQYLMPSDFDPVHGFYSLNGAIYIIYPGNVDADANGSKAFVKQIGPGFLWQSTHWNATLNVNYILERWRLFSAPYVNSRMLQPSFGITYTSPDSIMRVENGYKINVNVNAATRKLMSSVNYVQAQAQFKWIQTLGLNNRVIINTQVGATWVKALNRLPLSVRYFVGGPATILGFAYQDIGPGRYMAALDLAYQRRLTGDFYAQPFLDQASAFNLRRDFKSNLGRSAGLALVWRSPVGDIQIYWAKLISKPGNPNAFGFNLGAEL